MTESLSKNEDRKYEDVAIRLGRFVNNYTPPGWREHIQSVMPPFFFLAEDIKEMETSFKLGDLKQNLEKKYKNMHVVDAILTFFQNSTPRP